MCSLALRGTRQPRFVDMQTLHHNVSLSALPGNVVVYREDQLTPTGCRSTCEHLLQCNDENNATYFPKLKHRSQQRHGECRRRCALASSTHGHPYPPKNVFDVLPHHACRVKFHSETFLRVHAKCIPMQKRE